MGLSSTLMVLATLLPGQQLPEVLHHEFHRDRPLPAMLSLFGPNAADVIKSEDRGLRITPPTDGKQTFGWGVELNFSLKGDFEITGEYEWLNVAPPLRGGGVGVALTVQPNAERQKWAKVGRFRRVRDGDVNVAEVWTKKNSPTDYHSPSVPTQARAGKLCLVREGSILRCLATDGPGENFREIYQGEFGTDELEVVRFLANNNTSPTPVEVRLVDLRVRSKGQVLDQAATLAPPSDDTPTSNRWLGVIEFLGIGILVAMVMALGMWVYLRHGRRAEPMPPHDPVRDTPTELEAGVPVSFSCAVCGKNLKAKAQLAGKKVKCSQCGQAVLVPMISPGQP